MHRLPFATETNKAKIREATLKSHENIPTPDTHKFS